MANLALARLDAGQLDDALRWARRAALVEPLVAHAHRTHGKVALAMHRDDEAFEAFARALALEPSPSNHYNLGLALLALHRPAEALPHFEAGLADPQVARASADALAEAHRRLGH
jgi:Tfp pilus assembly protein PilF